VTSVANTDPQQKADAFMQSIDAKKPVSPAIPASDCHMLHKTDTKGRAKATGDIDMEPRFAELETHLKYIRRDMDEVRGDVKSIKHRLAYAAGATAVVLGLLGWVANSRFDQLVTLIG
jgi:Flp pilus assembly protein TadB